MEFDGPVLLGDDASIPYSDDRSYINPASGRNRNTPLVDNCIFCSDYIFVAISNTSGFRMLLYISFIYLMPIFFFWSKHSHCIDLSFLTLKGDIVPRNLAFLNGYPSVRFSFGLILALLLLFSDVVEVYCYLINFINHYVFGSSIDEFVYDTPKGNFGGRDVENTDCDVHGYDEGHSSYTEFTEWFGKLSPKLKYIHVFHHLRWLVMSFLVILPIVIIFSTNIVESGRKLVTSKYYIETMDFALGLLMPLMCILIFKCTIYPLYLIIVTILYRSNGYHIFPNPPHSLTVLCLQDACPCKHLVKEQVSTAIKQSLEFHAAYLGFGKIVFVSSVGILFVFSFISIVLL